MNQRIEKLFDQALAEFKAENKYATVVVPDPVQRDFVEKFARLIVRECAEVASDPLSFTEAAYCHARVLKHFGIQE